MTHATSSNHTRTLSIAVGMVIGLLAGGLISPMAHAATTHKVVKKKVTKAKKVKSKEVKTNKVTTAAVPMVALLAATTAQLQAAQHVLVGHYACEFGKELALTPHPQEAGYFSLVLGNHQWSMKPVLTSTGTIRLEDLSGKMLLMQILTKSMLMDTQEGRRLVDGCVHSTQREAQEQLRHNPQPSNF
jgi:formate hydrogenlyase subunit 3/multisubunit Na+/H+ antiporter MnhD subunit